MGFPVLQSEPKAETPQHFASLHCDQHKKWVSGGRREGPVCWGGRGRGFVTESFWFKRVWQILQQTSCKEGEGLKCNLLTKFLLKYFSGRETKLIGTQSVSSGVCKFWVMTINADSPNQGQFCVMLLFLSKNHHFSVHLTHNFLWVQSSSPHNINPCINKVISMFKIQTRKSDI